MATLPMPLRPGEVPVRSWVAGLPTGGGRGVEVGGTLMLTGERLIWTPLGRPGSRWAVPGLSASADRAWEVPLTQLRGVRPDPGRGALLHLDDVAGATHSLLIGASRLSPVWSRRSRAARDDAAAVIRGAAGLRS